MEDPGLKDEALLAFIAKYKAKGWNPSIIEKQYRDVKLFLMQFDIRVEPDKNSVTTDSIYYKYINARGIKTAMGRRRFTTIVKTLLAHKITRGLPVYRIDATKIGLPKEYSMYTDPRLDNRAPRKTKYRGVTPAPWREWMAEIELEGQMWLIGFFLTSHEAAEAYNKAAKYFLGKDAKLNKVYGKEKRRTISEYQEAKKKAKKRALAKLKRKKASVQS